MIFSAYNRQKSIFFSAYNRQNAFVPFLQYTKTLLEKCFLAKKPPFQRWFWGSSMFVSTCNGVRGSVLFLLYIHYFNRQNTLVRFFVDYKIKKLSDYVV